MTDGAAAIDGLARDNRRGTCPDREEDEEEEEEERQTEEEMEEDRATADALSGCAAMIRCNGNLGGLRQMEAHCPLRDGEFHTHLRLIHSFRKII